MRREPGPLRTIARRDMRSVSIETVEYHAGRKPTMSGPCLPFETLKVIDGVAYPFERYATLQEAEAGHWRWADREFCRLHERALAIAVEGDGSG